jgi:hypothetical protein
MWSCLVYPCKPFPSVRIAFLAILTMLLSGWTTFTAMVNFNNCTDMVPQPQITSLSPASVPGDTESVLLIVHGSRFCSPISDHVERKPTTDRIWRLTPTAGHDYSADV